MTLTSAKREIAKVLGVKSKVVEVRRRKVTWWEDKHSWEADVCANTDSATVRVLVRLTGQTQDSILVALIDTVKRTAPPTG